MFLLKKSAVATLCACSLLGLTACGSGGGGSSSSSSSVTVTPSLGQITNATVRILQKDNKTVLGSEDLNSTGTATVTFGGYSGPIVIEVIAKEGAKYFDEAKGQYLDLPVGPALRAMAPTESGSYGVTPLTEAAVIRAEQQNLFPLDENEVNVMNKKVGDAWANVLQNSNILVPPTLFNEKTSMGTFENTDAGKYAVLLASLAKLGEGNDKPMLAVFDVLYKDLDDGKIDSMYNNQAFATPYSNFATDFKAALNSMASSYASAGLNTALAGYTPSVSIDWTYTPPSDGSGSGAASGNYTLIVTPVVNGIAATNVTINNVPKPADQAAFCSSTDVQAAYQNAATPGTTLTVKSCSFDGMTGVMELEMNMTSPIAMTIPYKVTYKYQ